MKLKKYLRVWWMMARLSFLLQLTTKISSAGYLLGKLIRLFFFLAFIIAIFSHTQALKGYTLAQTALFFLTYNLVDISAQMFFRGVYSARRLVAEGDLDYYLIQPVNPLFRLASYLVDFLDFISLLPICAMIILAVFRLETPPGPAQVAAYLLMTANGILIAFSMHVFVAALAVRTQELENAIWLYRDLMVLGRFPIDIYARPLRWALTLVIPIAVMTSFPTQALLGLLSLKKALWAFAASGLFVSASLAFWRDSLGHYTSVSS